MKRFLPAVMLSAVLLFPLLCSAAENERERKPPPRQGEEERRPKFQEVRRLNFSECKYKEEVKRE